MEDVLDLYAEPENPKRPRVCFDESPYQLIRETRQVIAAQPGQVERHDFEYKREGSCNLFMFVCPERGWRHVKVTERRTILDVAHCFKDLVDVHFPDAEVIRLRSEEHTSELQSLRHLVCRLLLEKKKNNNKTYK